MTLLLSITQFKNSTKRALSIHNVHTHKNKTLRNSFFFFFFWQAERTSHAERAC